MTVRASRSPKIELAPAPGSIGANPALRLRIDGLLKEVEQYRYERIGKGYRFGTVYGELAKAFGLKASEWKNIWLQDEAVATEVIAWLEAKRDNTIQGRIKKAAKGEGYQHTRGHLFRIESDYLAQLGWDDRQARDRRQLIAGAASRKDLSDNEFRNWVGYLRREVERMYDETEN